MGGDGGGGVRGWGVVGRWGVGCERGGWCKGWCMACWGVSPRALSCRMCCFATCAVLPGAVRWPRRCPGPRGRRWHGRRQPRRGLGGWGRGSEGLMVCQVSLSARRPHHTHPHLHPHPQPSIVSPDECVLSRSLRFVYSVATSGPAREGTWRRTASMTEREQRRESGSRRGLGLGGRERGW